MSGKLRLLSLLLSALAVCSAACAEEMPGLAPTREQFYFPSSVALTPEIPGQDRLLLVASSNFDLRFRSGVLHAYSVAEIDRLVDEAVLVPAPNCQPEAPRCSPARIADFRSAFVDAVEIESFAGQIAVAEMPTGDVPLRAFVPVRSNQTVVAIDVTPGETGVLRCAQAGEERCRGVDFPRRDPFNAVAEAGNVYIGHVGRDNDDDPVGAIGAARADAAFWSGGSGTFSLIGLSDQPIGGLATGACRGVDADRTCTLFATGRSFEDGFNPVFLFDFREDALRSGPVFSRNVFAQQRGFDSRGLAVSTSGNTIFVASRFPSAVATIDVTRIDPEPVDGCVVPPGELVPPAGACPGGPLPLNGEAEPRFVTADLNPIPVGGNMVMVIPRVTPGGEESDLVVLTTDTGLWFHDTRTGQAAGAVEEVGSAPAAVAFRRIGDGARLYVPSFGNGTLAVVDVPDLFRPSSAEVVAILGRRQEGSF